MNRKFWTDLWFLLLAVGLGLIVTMLLMFVIMALMGQSTVALHLMQWIQNILTFLLPSCLWVRYYKKESIAEVLHFGWPGWTMLGLTLVLMLVSAPAMNYFCTLCEQMPMPQALYDYGMQMKGQQDPLMEKIMDVDGVGGWLALVMLMCVMTGLTEEVLFRGALLRCMRGSGLWCSAIVIGLVFAAIHFEVFGFLPRTLLGAFFVWLVVRSGSIWPAVLAHALNNLLALITMKATAPQWLDDIWEAGWCIALSAALTTVVIWLMAKALPRR